MSAAHTPGPWYYGTEEQGRIVIRSSTTGLPYVAETLSTNGSLIAAAPDLLYALREILADIDYAGARLPLGTIGTLRIRLAIAAIAKAEGKL